MTLQEIARIERELAHFNMLRHQKQYSFPTGSVSPNGVSIAGSCGHLFIGEGSNNWISQLSGSTSVGATDIDAWVALIQERRERADEKSVKLCNLIVPEKQIVLHNFFGHQHLPPSWANRPAIRIIDSLPERLGVVYPADAMRERQSWAELYWRGNSHWCASGCITAVELILKEFALECDVEKIPLQRLASQHDLIRHFTPDVPDEEILYISASGTVSNAENSYAVTGSHTGSKYSISNPRAAVDETLVLFGDSYSFDAGLTYALSACFSTVHFIWSKNVNWNKVHEHSAKYVVWESAERFLSTIPSS